jgi:hypothetical protein
MSTPTHMPPAEPMAGKDVQENNLFATNEFNSY